MQFDYHNFLATVVTCPANSIKNVFFRNSTGNLHEMSRHNAVIVKQQLAAYDE